MTGQTAPWPSPKGLGVRGPGLPGVRVAVAADPLAEAAPIGLGVGGLFLALGSQRSL